ncbi:tetratricopeptide repeat protein [Nostoc spongiaeforme FACHB-130]|uniref:Tetratricopeptide repeat protein n=1 Tax=Nostoc spongiaeforme FACHB-130 TaxID=1357510 RepID=A0ABR8FZR8_9NOSO|nr:tetratricopeptide repeat protein [Nostoc spongiaeforme]MBD2596204.1 tetratricopeptide repeat protein [Nostoc spongiaeforme FACHB-130]
MTNFWRFLFSLLVVFSVTFASQLLLPSTSLAQRVSNQSVDLGVVQMQQGNYELAIVHFNQAIAQNGKNAVAYSNRCLAYLHLQDYHQAIADCTQAINFSPNNVEAYLNRGLAHYRQGNYLSAIDDDNLAIAHKPQDFRAYYNRGVAHNAIGDHTSAITDFNLALTQIPLVANIFFADIYNDRGLAHFQLHNLDAAMQDFHLAIRFNAYDYRAYFNLGCVCGRNGDNTAAVNHFSEVIRLDPSNGQAYLNRAIAQYYLGYNQRAIADLNKASEYFEQQNQKIAYERTKDLLHRLQQEVQLAIQIG